MKKNKILIGVISIMFAGIITLGIIECNNSNTKDNNKLFIGNGKFCQAKRLNGLGPFMMMTISFLIVRIKYMNRIIILIKKTTKSLM